MADEPTPAVAPESTPGAPPASPSLMNQPPAEPAPVTNDSHWTLQALQNKSEWKQLVPEDIRQTPTLAKYDNTENPFGEVAKALVNADRAFGSEKFPAPRDDWGLNDWREHYARLGCPDDASKYNLEGVTRPEGMSWDESVEKRFLAKAYDSGLNDRQATALLNEYGAIAAEQMTGLGAMSADIAEANERNLKEEWGAAYTNRMKQAQQSATSLLGQDNPIFEKAFQDGTRFGDDPTVIKLFAELHTKVTGEGSGSPSLTAVGPTMPTPAEATERLDRMIKSPEAWAAMNDPMHPRHSELRAEREMLIKAKLGDRAYASTEKGVSMG